MDAPSKRRHGVAQSLIFTWRRQARAAKSGGRNGSILLPVEIDAITAPSRCEAARQSRAAATRWTMRFGGF